MLAWPTLLGLNQRAHVDAPREDKANRLRYPYCPDSALHFPNDCAPLRPTLCLSLCSVSRESPTRHEKIRIHAINGRRVAVFPETTSNFRESAQRTVAQMTGPARPGLISGAGSLFQSCV